MLRGVGENAGVVFVEGLDECNGVECPLVFREGDKFLELLARAACARRLCLNFDVRAMVE